MHRMVPQCLILFSQYCNVQCDDAFLFLTPNYCIMREYEFSGSSCRFTFGYPLEIVESKIDSYIFSISPESNTPIINIGTMHQLFARFEEHPQIQSSNFLAVIYGTKLKRKPKILLSKGNQRCL